MLKPETQAQPVTNSLAAVQPSSNAWKVAAVDTAAFEFASI
jgi:hypothetical protein